MTLLRFMSRIWYYRIFGPATFLFAVAVPWALLKYGTPSEAWLMVCTLIAVFPLVLMLFGAYSHMKTVHVRSLEAKWRKANHQCPAYVPRDLERLFIAQRKDPWWEE